MEFIKALVGGLLAQSSSIFVIIFFLIVIYWIAYEVSQLVSVSKVTQKIIRFARASGVAFVGSYLGGLYIDGLGEAPSGYAWKILFFPIIVVSFFASRLFAYRNDTEL